MDSYNYYFFDLDGTISESAPGIVKAVKYGLDQAGIHEEDAEKLHSFIGPPLNVQMKKLYGMTDEQIVTAVTAFRKLYEDEGGLYDCEAYDGIGDLLYDLKKEGKVLAVASSKPEPFVRKIIDRSPRKPAAARKQKSSTKPWASFPVMEMQKVWRAGPS